MIVRPQRHADGRKGWLLIAQQAHARLAFDLCQGWRPLLAFVDPAALEAAILHHDDGWLGWDAQPGVDPVTGRPRDFLNMELPVVLPMWTASIDGAAQYSPLTAYVVSGHFSALLEHSKLVEQPGNEELARIFLADEANRRSRALQQWLREDPAEPGVPARTAEAADWALACLQFFDRFSLWLCCAENYKAATLPLPGGDQLRLDPRTPYDIEVDPWTWEVPQLQLSVTGAWIPARTYRDAADVLAAREGDHRLTWTLRPSR